MSSASRCLMAGRRPHGPSRHVDANPCRQHTCDDAHGKVARCQNGTVASQQNCLGRQTGVGGEGTAESGAQAQSHEPPPSLIGPGPRKSFQQPSQGQASHEVDRERAHRPVPCVTDGSADTPPGKRPQTSPEEDEQQVPPLPMHLDGSGSDGTRSNLRDIAC